LTEENFVGLISPSKFKNILFIIILFVMLVSDL